jgi:hypothetical protein
MKLLQIERLSIASQLALCPLPKPNPESNGETFVERLPYGREAEEPAGRLFRLPPRDRKSVV